MNKRDNPIREKVIKGLELTYQKLLKFKKERNLDFVISDKGDVRKIPAKDC